MKNRMRKMRKQTVKRLLTLCLFCCLVSGKVMPFAQPETTVQPVYEKAVVDVQEIENDQGTETGQEAKSGQDAESGQDTETDQKAESGQDTENDRDTENNQDTETGQDTESSQETENQWETERSQETENEWETGNDQTTECDQGTENGQTTECDQITETDGQTEDETTEECDQETAADDFWDEESEDESETENLEAHIPTPYLAELTSSGKTVVGASGWTQAESIDRLSSTYYPVRFYSGVSSLESFCTSSSVNQVVMDDRIHFYPTATGAGGKFGVIYRKVLYYNYQWYDLKMTVTAYSSQVRCDGGDKVSIFPFMEFRNDKIGFYFHDAVGEYVMKCEFLNSTTGDAEKVNTRFQWQDIDSAQRFGIRLEDGSIAARYYYGDSRVYYQNGQSVAGVKKLEMVVGPPANYDTTDMKNAAVYELKQCSTYYMAIGFRDHLDDDENSLTKSTLTKWKAQLEAKEYTGNKSYLRQTDSEMNIIQTPAPEKQVASGTNDWGTENVLKTIRSEYQYRILQFVPWQNTNAYYESFTIKDELPDGVEYVGSLKILRSEDGKNVTDWFTITTKSQSMTAKAKSSTCSNADFYGYHYIVTFRVKMNPEQTAGVYDGKKVAFTVKNEASVVIKHTAESKTVEAVSNQVVTKAEETRIDVPDPVKGFESDPELTEKQLWNRDDEIVFAVFQNIPVNDAIFSITDMEISDTLESCLMYQSCAVKYQAAGETKWNTENDWAENVQGQKISISKSEGIDEYAGGTILWQIRCKIRKDTDLTQWKKTEGEEDWTEIPNRAVVAVAWNKGTPERVTKETNTATVKLQQMSIHLKKQIDAEDIVWAHGNPIFTFCVEGTDLNGHYHVWNQTVEFQKENTPGSGKTTCEVVFQVPAGVYVASELPVIRYQLAEIHSIKGGKSEQDTVVFDLSTQQIGEAVFYNEKTTDEDESDTCLVKNRIG